MEKRKSDVLCFAITAMRINASSYSPEAGHAPNVLCACQPYYSDKIFVAADFGFPDLQGRPGAHTSRALVLSS
jgi:hypothetical protein